MLRIAVMVSGGGTNLQAILDKISEGCLPGCRVVTVVSSKAGVYALERAKANNIPWTVISKNDYDSLEAYDEALISHMQSCGVELVVLAGFLSLLGEKFVRAYHNAVINVHPSLIPAFCGKGYYGLTPHRKVLEKGIKVTGATVHFVDPEYDSGPIILQKAVEVLEGDTPEVLQRRVMEQAEWKLLPEAVRLFSQGRLKIEGRHVRIE